MNYLLFLHSYRRTLGSLKELFLSRIGGDKVVMKTTTIYFSGTYTYEELELNSSLFSMIKCVKMHRLYVIFVHF